MPTPTKPYQVLKNEKRSHRTKKELELRKKGEEALASGHVLKERKEVRKNKVAHKEFLRVNKLLKSLEKNDGLYEAVVNRYCLLQAEVQAAEQERQELQELLDELHEDFNEAKAGLAPGEKMELIAEYAQTVLKISGQISARDKLLLTKRKMLLDIEKENVMTIASALRSIPKKEEKASNPLLEALRNA